jgi:transposase
MDDLYLWQALRHVVLPRAIKMNCNYWLMHPSPSRRYLAFRMTNSNALVQIRHKFQLLRPIMDERMRRRWAASEAMSLGWGGITTVVQATGLAANTICRGIAELKDAGGREGERPNMPVRPRDGPKPPGRPYKLTDERLGELEALLSKGAPAHGWTNELWTIKRVAKVIRKHFGLTLSRQTVCTVLKKRMRWSRQVPTRQLRGRDDVKIELWLTEEYPRILERARRRHAYLVFIDESGFMLAPLLRRTFAPRGKQPISKNADPHGKISVIGAMTISPERHNFGFHFHLACDNVNFSGHSIVPFIESLRRRIPGPFTIIWDGIRIHGAKPLADYFTRHRKIVIESFPPEASEVNPADKVWGYVKHARLPNYTPPDLKELRRRITSEFKRLRKRPDLLEALFRRTGLTLDLREPIRTSWSADGRLIVGEHRRKSGGWPS